MSQRSGWASNVHTTWVLANLPTDKYASSRGSVHKAQLEKAMIIANALIDTFPGTFIGNVLAKITRHVIDVWRDRDAASQPSATEATNRQLALEFLCFVY